MNNNLNLKANYAIAVLFFLLTWALVKDLFLMRASYWLLLIPFAAIISIAFIFIFPNIKLWIKITALVLYVGVVGYVVRSNTISKDDIKGYWRAYADDIGEIRLGIDDDSFLITIKADDDSLVDANDYDYYIEGKYVSVTEPRHRKEVVYELKIEEVKKDTLIIAWQNKSITFVPIPE